MIVDSLVPRSTIRAAGIALVGALLLVVFFYVLGWIGWVQTALGVHAKITLGALHGTLWARYVARIDLSSHAVDDRWKPGLAVAAYVVGFAVCAALGA